MIGMTSGSSLVHSKTLRSADNRVSVASTQQSHEDPKAEDLSKKMPLKAQEQGFEGEKVQHKDQKTSIGDWQNEYGHETKEAAAPKKILRRALRHNRSSCP